MAKYYKISSERLIALADQARRLGNVSGELTLEQMECTLKGVTPGGSGVSMFASRANGTLPTVYRGTARSTGLDSNKLIFETSATGEEYVEG